MLQAMQESWRARRVLIVGGRELDSRAFAAILRELGARLLRGDAVPPGPYHIAPDDACYMKNIDAARTLCRLAGQPDAPIAVAAGGASTPPALSGAKLRALCGQPRLTDAGEGLLMLLRLTAAAAQGDGALDSALAEQARACLAQAARRA